MERKRHIPSRDYVYVVTESDYDDVSIIGVYSSPYQAWVACDNRGEITVYTLNEDFESAFSIWSVENDEEGDPIFHEW